LALKGLMTFYLQGVPKKCPLVIETSRKTNTYFSITKGHFFWDTLYNDNSLLEKSYSCCQLYFGNVKDLPGVSSSLDRSDSIVGV